jgi:ATP-dependent Clp protease protease subunit
MNSAHPAPSIAEALARPQVRLHGDVDEEMLRCFRDALEAAEAACSARVVLELTTPGGDADVARRIATDIRLHRERTGREPLFLGKAVVYSAGVTIMAAFGRDARWLTRGTALLIHGRSLARTVELDGPLAQQRKRLEALIAEIDMGLQLERRGFEDLIAGSAVPLEELLERAETNWYLDAADALRLGLVGGVL